MQKVETTLAPAAIGPYSQAIISGNLVYTSGQIPLIPSTGEMTGITATEQTTRVLENLKAVLEAAGSSLDKIVKATCFLQDMNDFAEFNEVFAKYITHAPARSTIQVARLPKDALVEIEVIAEIS